MKLINDLLKVLETSVTEAGFITKIKLNPNNIIYTGHFPGHPVTPGVIQMQIIHELIENHFCKNVRLIKMPKCKFLKILNPIETSQIDVHIESTGTDELLNIKAWGENRSVIFFRLNAVYQFI